MTGTTGTSGTSGLFAGPALLFCPADRPDRFARAAAAADVVILDLEDAVAGSDRAGARLNLLAEPLDPARTVIRVNPVATADHRLDLEILARTEYRMVMLAKTEQADDVRAVATAARTAGWTAGVQVIALCETALGVLNAASIAAEPATVALMWGAEDLIVSLAGRASRFPDGRYRQIARHARNQVLLAAGGYGRSAIDAVYLDLADHDGLRAEAEDAAASGFTAKACIHPGQVAVVRQGFEPSDAQLRWARAVLEAGAAAAGVFRFDGRMVDQPVLDQARRMLQAATQAPGAGP